MSVAVVPATDWFNPEVSSLHTYVVLLVPLS
jgi:hypothetical protein